MSNKVAASMTASIIIDKKEVISSALAAYASAQKEIEGNKIELLVDVSDDEALKRLKEIQKELSGKDYIIKFKNQGIDETLKSLDELYEKIKAIISGKNLGNGKGIGNFIVDEKTLENVLNTFTDIEKHLSALKRTISDVGDGEEFSPLLKMINNVKNSIDSLVAITGKGSTFNMNIDVGSNTELEAKVQSKISNALQAYQRLFEHIKLSNPADSIITNKFFEFDINQYDTMMGKLQAYKKFIDNMRKEAKSRFNGKDVLFQYTDKSYWSSASAAMAQVTKAFNEMNYSSDKSQLGELFGKTDLTDVIKQLELIAEDLGKISSVATEFKNSFQNGFNVTASVEEIEKLTNKVKELESELNEFKTSSTAPIETNLSSSILNTNTEKELSDSIDLAKDLDATLDKVDIPINSFDEVLEKLNLAKSELVDIVRITKQAHADKDGKMIESYILKDSFGSTETYGASSNTEKGQMLAYKYINDNTKAINEQRKAEKELQRQQEKSNAEKLKEEENKKLEKQKENYNELNRVIDRYSTVRKRIANGNSLSSDKQEVKDLKESIDNLHKTDLLSEEQFKNAKIRLDNLETSVKDIIALTRQSTFDSMQSDIDSYYKRLNSLKIKPSEIDRSPGYTKALDEYKDSIDKLEKHLAILRNTTEEFTEKDKKDWENLTKSVQEAYDKIKSFSSAQKGSSVHSREKEIDKLTKYLKENTKISKTARKELENYLNILKNGGASVNVQEIHTEWTKVAVAEREAGREGKAFFDILGDKTLYGYAAQLAGYYLSLMDFVRYGKAVIDNVIEINTAQTELRKVSDATENRLTKNFKTSAETAKDLGAAITDVISATADWSRMGYNVDDAEELARISTLYKNVGDGIDIEAANASLISTLQGFQLTADEAEGVIDRFNEVSNNFAIDSAGIGEALQRSAASFNAANTDLSKSIALITAANEVVQDPDSVGTLWKTMSARIRGASTELNQLGEETDEYTQSTSKLRDLVMGLTGFDIMLDENTFKDIYEIILGIGEEWHNLTDIEQASLGEALAGEIYCLKNMETYFYRTHLIARIA